MNNDLTAYYKSKGIVHQTTAPYTPEQNGAVERLNHVLVEKARSMLYESTLPQEYWAEAIVTANYLRNLSPTSSRPKTPWELYYSHKPDVSNLYMFGSTAHIHIPQQQRSKLDQVSIKGNFVGYEPASKAYRIVVPITTNFVKFKIMVSCNVIFDETPQPNLL